jgi:hypothetical protein
MDLSSTIAIAPRPRLLGPLRVGPFCPKCFAMVLTLNTQPHYIFVFPPDQNESIDPIIARRGAPCSQRIDMERDPARGRSVPPHAARQAYEQSCPIAWPPLVKARSWYDRAHAMARSGLLISVDHLCALSSYKIMVSVRISHTWSLWIEPHIKGCLDAAADPLQLRRTI